MRVLALLKRPCLVVAVCCPVASPDLRANAILRILIYKVNKLTSAADVAFKCILIISGNITVNNRYSYCVFMKLCFHFILSIYCQHHMLAPHLRFCVASEISILFRFASDYQKVYRCVCLLALPFVFRVYAVVQQQKNDLESAFFFCAFNIKRMKTPSATLQSHIHIVNIPQTINQLNRC